MPTLNRSKLRTVTGVRGGRWCLAAALLATSALPAVTAQASQNTAQPTLRTENEEQVSAQQASYRRKKIYNGPGRRTGGGTSRESGTYATSDLCYVAPGTASIVLRVFDNDSLDRGSEISWATAYGTAELTETEPWGFKYQPSHDHPEDTLFYQIASPDDRPEYSDTTVSIDVTDQHQEGCV